MRERHNMQEQKPETNNTTTNQIITKVSTSENILIALSQNPTADELAAAIGLSILLDKIGKHATAIYSGETPSIIEFLEPEQRLETNTDSLQDFIIALNKDKADHLHYKVDGDYVKIYITPYKTKISEEDLEFSYGDFNIGLVVALNVENENSLDQALTSHGRILHDAEVINITASAPGDFGNIQWSDPAASSISEMVAELAFLIGGELGVEIDGEVATALLTGIVVATDRFSTNRTQPETMTMAARLMEVGANQQLISEYMRKTEDEEGEKNNGVDDQADEGKGEAQEDTGRTEDDKEDESLLTIQREESDKTGINKQDEYVQDAHTENEQNTQGEQLNQDIQAQNTNESKTDQLIIEQKNGSEPAEATNASIASQRPILKPLGQSGGSEGAGLNIQNPSSVNLAPLGGLKDSPRGEVSQDEKTSSIKMDTPFEETPAPAFVDNKDDTMVGVPAPQPVVGNGDKTNSLASLGAKSSVDESVMNELKNLPDNPAPLGKDYSAVEVPASEAISEHEYMSDNPASAAAPGVSEGPEENHLPGLDFSNPVSMSEDEPAASQNNNSYVIESTSVEPVSQNVTGGVNLQPLTQDIPSATLEPKPQGMPLPGDEVLPPPPTPPIDFASIQPEQPAPEPVVQPVVQSNPVLQPVQSEPQSPGLPPVDQSILGNEAVAAPTSFQQPQAQPQAQAPVAPPVAPTNDPGAFRIPGT